MNIHVDTLFAWGGVIYRPGQACAPEDAARWAIERGYARALDAVPAAPEAAPENKAHAAAPKRAVKPKTTAK